MKKIGIITHYYNSTNFGGNLQAYALTAYLKKINYDAEQLSFPLDTINLVETGSRFDKLFASGFKSFCTWSVYYARKTIQLPFVKNEEKKHCVSERRKKAFVNFNHNIIPHSKEVYHRDTIAACVDDYDAFITGSDQVWNLRWYSPAFFLDFVPSDKIKISYAASLAMDSLTDEQKDIFKKSLSDYKAVSVREQKAIELIGDNSPVPPVYVLDPTLLLSQDDWNEVCSERVVAEDYVFCYFLGENKRERKIARQFAKKHNLKLVTVPHAGGGIKYIDRNFGDIKLYDTSPEQFISLIKYAKYVFTDSFHAVVFSNIYQKQFFVFNRSKKGEMSSRIKDITELFNAEDRFCYGNDRENIDYIEGLPYINYSVKNERFEALRQQSMNFLKNSLEV